MSGRIPHGNTTHCTELSVDVVCAVRAFFVCMQGQRADEPPSGAARVARPRERDDQDPEQAHRDVRHDVSQDQDFTRHRDRHLQPRAHRLVVKVRCAPGALRH